MPIFPLSPYSRHAFHPPFRCRERSAFARSACARRVERYVAEIHDADDAFADARLRAALSAAPSDRETYLIDPDVHR